MFFSIKLKTIKIFVFIIAFLIAILSGIKFIDYSLPVKYEDIIGKYAKHYNLKEELVYSVINIESRFNTDAVSNKGAIGLMQIMPETGIWLAEKAEINSIKEDDLFLPEKNIELGCFYLSYLIDKFKDERLALAAYNAGTGNVYKWLDDEEYIDETGNLSIIPFEETEKYIDKVNISKIGYKLRLSVKNIFD